MNRRTIAILIFIVGILILSAVGIVYVLQQGSGGDDGAAGDVADLPPGDANTPPADIGLPPGVEPGEPLPEMVEVVVSIQTVPRGWQLSETELATDLRLASEVGPNVVTDIADAAGRYARTDIFQGETLTFDALITDPTILGENEFGPSSLIPPGFVAAAVPMDRLSGVAYGLQAGDSIDILISFYFYQIDEQFQSYLPNSAQFFIEETLQGLEGEETDPGTAPSQLIVLDPFGRFEALPTGDLAHVAPSESLQRPVLVSMLLQNAKVIQVGSWTPPEAVQGPTPTPEPVEGDATVTPGPPPPTITPVPRVLLVALSPQQHLFLKYAVESNADIDYALRSVQDGQLYSVQNVDINLILERFGIEIPPNFNYSVDTDDTARATATPVESTSSGSGTVTDGSDS